jgi:hypothetical protein
MHASPWLQQLSTSRKEREKQRLTLEQTIKEPVQGKAQLKDTSNQYVCMHVISDSA